MKQHINYHTNRRGLAQRREAASGSGYQRASVSATASVQIREAERREAPGSEREQAAKSALEQGIRPIQMPTRTQVQAARERIPYNPEKIHFAVCGTSGSGKSSLINAFRGFGQRERDSAAVGVTETTYQVTRYPDPRTKLPYSRFVWYDIPGAGTSAVSDWQYFNNQGLFEFDIIIMVYDVRFTTIDASILLNCYRFNIPVFVLRSKADQHIENMMKAADIDCRPGDDDYDKIYQEIKMKYVNETKNDFHRNMKKLSESPEVDDSARSRLLHVQRVELVDAANVRRLMQSEAENGTGVRGGVAQSSSKLIDEELLVKNIVRVAGRVYRRRL